MNIFFLGHKGKIGSQLIDLFDDKFLNIDNNLIKIDYPPYSRILNNINKSERIVILKSLYSRNIFSYILTSIALLNFKSRANSFYVIELCSIVQLIQFRLILKYPKYLFYYINRKLQSLFCWIIISLLGGGSIYRIYFGKIKYFFLKI